MSEQLLREAIRNASEKAAILASAAGVSLGKIQRIDYDWSELRLISDTHYFNPLSMDMHAPSAAMDIEPDDIETNDSVTVIWEIA